MLRSCRISPVPSTMILSIRPLTRCCSPHDKRISGEKYSPRFRPLSFKVSMMLSIGLTSICSPDCKLRLSAGVALFRPRAYSPRSLRRILQNSQIAICRAMPMTLQLPTRTSLKHFSSRPHRDKVLAAFSNSLA